MYDLLLYSKDRGFDVVEIDKYNQSINQPINELIKLLASNFFAGRAKRRTNT